MDFSALLRKVSAKESVVLAAVPAIGFCVSTESFGFIPFLKFLLLVFASFLMFGAARVYENTAEKNSEGAPPFPIPDWVLFLGLFAISLGIVFLFFKGVLWNWIFAFIIFSAYSHDGVDVRHVPVLNALLLFGVMLFVFTAGFGAAGPVTVNGFLFGIYFAALVLGGFLNGELADSTLNAELQKGSNVAAFGPDRILRFSFTAFAFAFLLLMILTMSRIINGLFAAPFLIAFLIQAVLFVRNKSRSDAQSAIWYQGSYRLIYGCAAGLFVILRIIF